MKSTVVVAASASAAPFLEYMRSDRSEEATWLIHVGGMTLRLDYEAMEHIISERDRLLRLGPTVIEEMKKLSLVKGIEP